MKYSIGDKVRVKSIDWYNQMLSIPEKNVWRNKLTDEFAGIWCGSKVFYVDMCEFCGRVMTIQEVGIDFYLMEEDKMGYEFTDEMIAGEDVSWMYDGNLVSERFSDDKEVPKFKKDDRVETHDGLFGYIEDIEYDDVRNCYQYYVSFIVDGGYYYEDQLKFHERGSADSKLPKFKVGDMICRVGGLSNGCLVTSVSDEYYALQMGEGNVGVLPVADQDEWVLLSAGGDKIEEDEVEVEKDDIVWNLGGGRFQVVLPKGYRFVDVGGNPIAVDKIVLEKEGVCYPKNYGECCEIVKVEKKHTLEGEIIRKNNYKIELLESFQKLLICRDAYWKIAGDEMGLGKPWEPDWREKRYIIYRNQDNIIGGYRAAGCAEHHIFEFPTKEMRDAFKESDEISKLIEKCKELL